MSLFVVAFWFVASLSKTQTTLLSQLPKSELLEKYDLRHYEGVTEAVRDGNLQVFNEAMLKHQVIQASKPKR